MTGDFDIREFETLDLPGLLTPHVTEIIEVEGRRERVNVTDPRCDFCLEPLPSWSIPCADFVYPGTKEGSIGPWDACDACADLVRKDDPEALVLRSLIPVTGLSNDEVEGYRQAVTAVQALFWQFKTGDPERIRE